jgi:cardiolipin synthase
VTWTIAVLLVAVAVLGLAIWSIKRHKDPHLEHLDSDRPLEELIPSLAGMALGMPIPGNAVEIFQNGAFFDALLEDIRAARHTVHFETFLWKDGKLSQRVAETLRAKAREGVTVRLVLDAQGTRRMGEAMRDRLREAGCQLRSTTRAR